MNHSRPTTPEAHGPLPTTPGGPGGSTAEQLASRHLEDQVAKARVSLRRTRIVSILAMLIVLAYMGVTVVTLRLRLLNPQSAASVATLYASEFVQENGPALSKLMVKEVPPMVGKLPDVALQELPKFRAQIEDQLEETLTVYAREMAPHLARNLDTFLVDHQAEVREFMRAGQDPAVVKAFGARFEQQFFTLLNTPDKDRRTAMDRLHEGTQALEYIEARLDRLARDPNLTPEEKQLRRAIGLFMNTVERTARSTGTQG